MSIKFVTDSVSGILPTQREAMGIAAIVASFVRFGEESFRENVDISIAEFHAKLKSDPRFPTTSSPSVGDFEEAFRAHADSPIICINVSRELSGTVSAAENAARMVEGAEITVIDSRTASGGQVLLIREAQRMAKAGKNNVQIKAALEAIIPTMTLLLVVDTLENLKRGGRIGGAQAMLGSLLNMKPILTLKEGKLQPLERVRTYGKAVQRVKDLVNADLKGKQNIRMSVLHAASPAAAQELATDLAKSCNLSEKPIVIEVGASVAAHAGPGAVGVAYFVV